jgi:hypothetical protein
MKVLNKERQQSRQVEGGDFKVKCSILANLPVIRNLVLVQEPYKLLKVNLSFLQRPAGAVFKTKHQTRIERLLNLLLTVYVRFVLFRFAGNPGTERQSIRRPLGCHQYSYADVGLCQNG